MRDTVFDFLLIRIGLVVGFAYTLRDHFGIALFMAGVLAVGALHSSCIF